MHHLEMGNEAEEVEHVGHVAMELNFWIVVNATWRPAGAAPAAQPSPRPPCGPPEIITLRVQCLAVVDDQHRTCDCQAFACDLPWRRRPWARAIVQIGATALRIDTNIPDVDCMNTSARSAIVWLPGAARGHSRQGPRV